MDSGASAPGDDYTDAADGLCLTGERITDPGSVERGERGEGHRAHRRHRGHDPELRGGFL